MKKLVNSIFLENLLLLLIIGIFLLIGFHELQSLPGEWYGDISTLNTYVQNILRGNWEYDFVTSSGPLYFYLIAPLVKIIGTTYLTYKIISLLFGALGLVFIYLFAKQVANELTATIATFTTAVSFWYIASSRLGNFPILTPVLSAAMMYYFLKASNTGKLCYLAGSILVASLGLFMYAGTFVLPLVLVLLLIVRTSLKPRIFPIKRLLFTLLLFLPPFLLFILLLSGNWNNYAHGYMGVKVFGNHALSINDIYSKTLQHIIKTLGMLHVMGDPVFRWNVPNAPMLDTISGILFLLGIVYGFMKKRPFMPYLVLPLIVIPIPSLLPSIPLSDIPSSVRTLAIIPFVFIFVAYGLELIMLFITKISGEGYALTGAFCIIGCIMYLNLYKYFITYPYYLPNHNTAFGSVIGKYITSLPLDTTIYIPYTQWGDWGQPSFDSIYYAVNDKRRTLRQESPTCTHLKNTRYAVILSPRATGQLNFLKSCNSNTKAHLVRENDQSIFYSLTSL